MAADSIAAEADRLSALIGTRYRELRERELGKHAVLDGVDFRLIQADRNALYRVRAERSWYLKIPTSGEGSAIEREARGNQAVASLRDQSGYAGPAGIRISIDEPWILTSEIPGRPLNIALYRACAFPARSSWRFLERGFERLGEVLAKFHAQLDTRDHPTTDRHTAEILERHLDTVREPDRRVASMRRCLDRRTEEAASVVVHGNLKMENVLLNEDRVSLIDFENCGSGSPYEDLMWPCAQLRLLETVVYFPGLARAHRAVGRFLAAYANERRVDRRILGSYVRMRVFQYYVRMHHPRIRSFRIAGVPVQRGKLARLVDEVLEASDDEVVRSFH